MESVFSKIIRREIPADIVYETESILAFRDISPQAPVHILVVPKQSIRNLFAAQKSDQMILGELMLAAAEVARQQGLGESGFRLIVNNGEAAGQTVFHLHLHILGGSVLTPRIV
jgi:histidine triad (HIT) family protein